MYPIPSADWPRSIRQQVLQTVERKTKTWPQGRYCWPQDCRRCNVCPSHRDAFERVFHNIPCPRPLDGGPPGIHVEWLDRGARDLAALQIFGLLRSCAGSHTVDHLLGAKPALVPFAAFRQTIRELVDAHRVYWTMMIGLTAQASVLHASERLCVAILFHCGSRAGQ
jgi:hypothetical protein